MPNSSSNFMCVYKETSQQDILQSKKVYVIRFFWFLYVPLFYPSLYLKAIYFSRVHVIFTSRYEFELSANCAELHSAGYEYGYDKPWPDIRSCWRIKTRVLYAAYDIQRAHAPRLKRGDNVGQAVNSLLTDYTIVIRFPTGDSLRILFPSTPHSLLFGPNLSLVSRCLSSLPDNQLVVVSFLLVSPFCDETLNQLEFMPIALKMAASCKAI